VNENVRAQAAVNKQAPKAPAPKAHKHQPLRLIKLTKSSKAKPSLLKRINETALLGATKRQNKKPTSKNDAK